MIYHVIIFFITEGKDAENVFLCLLDLLTNLYDMETLNHPFFENASIG